MTDRLLDISVVTPYRAVFEGSASYIQVPLHDGLAGVQRGHMPMIARLAPGKLTVHFNETERVVFIDGGFIEVSHDRVNVMAHNAIMPADIKLDDLVHEKEELVSRRVAGDEDIEVRLERMQSIRGRLALIKK